MMLKPYTLNEVADMIQTAIDSAGDDKGHGVQGALDDLHWSHWWSRCLGDAKIFRQRYLHF